MAANRIKGITIEIDGNTTKLQDSLKSVDKQLKTTKSALADVNKLLKGDPKNTELLTQKQKLLSSAITDTKDRLEKLKTASTEALSEEQYDALQREIAATEQDLKNLEDQYKALGDTADNAFNKVGTAIQTAGGKISEAGGKITAVGDKITGAGKAMMPVSAAVTGLGAGAIKAAQELDEGYDTIITKTGATGEAAEELTDIMNEIFTEIPTDAETAGNAVGEVTTRFGLSGDALKRTSKTFIQFSEITGTDLNSAIDSVDSVMKQFGVDTSQTDNVLGLMASETQHTGISVDTLTSSVQTNGAILKEMGLSLSDSITLLSDMEISGVNTTTAMTGLRKAQQYATKQGKSMTSVLKSTQAAIKGAKTDTEATAIATEIFGKKAGPEMAQAIREGRLSLDSLNTSLDSYATTVEDTYNATLDPWDQMTVATNNLKLAGSELASSLFSELKPILDQLAATVKSFTSWFNSLDESQKQTIIRIGLIVAAAAPLLMIAGSMISSIGHIVSAGGALVSGIGVVTKAIGAAGGLIPAIGALASAAGPFLVGGAIIAGIIAAVVLIVKNWDSIKKALGNLWKGIKEFAGGVVKVVKSIGSGIVSGFGVVKTTFQNGWNTAKTLTVNAWNGMKSTLSNTWSTMRSTLASGFQSAASIVTGFKNTVAGTFRNIFQTIKSPLDKALDFVGNVVKGIKNAFHFNIQLPKIKLPHISVKWKKIGDFFSIPRLSIEWYRKAYSNPMMFNSPTVLQTPSGYKGFGDGSGGEMVYGHDNLMRDIRAAVGGGGDTIINIYSQPGQDVNALADAVQRRLAAVQRQKGAVYA